MIAKKALLLIVAVLTLAPLWAAADEIDPVVKRERDSYAMSCKEIQFMPEALWTGDINKDGKNDVIVNSAAVACDKEFGAECTNLGCPIRLYVQTDDGVFSYVGQVRAYDYAISYRYGIRVLDFRIGGSRCKKINASKCSMIARIEGRELVTLSTEVEQ
jgi:hypothetical protein